MNFSFLNNQNYILNYQNGVPFKFSEKIFEDISWDSVLSLLSDDVFESKKIRESYYKGMGAKLDYADRHLVVKLIADDLHNIFEYAKMSKKERPNSAHQLYINFVKTSLDLEEVNNLDVPGPNKHLDNENVFFICAQGQILWRIYDVLGKNLEHEFLLSKGEIIFCPPHRHHEVISLTPRVGVSLGFGKLKQ
jgi:mannose-6-phosphate isomerase-like protein (cupin superfamily)